MPGMMAGLLDGSSGADQLVRVFMAYKPLKSQEGKFNAGLSFANVDLVAALTLLDAILDKKLQRTTSLIAPQRCGKSVALGLGIAGAIAAGCATIYGTTI
ncbi:hypothetical protein U1Q18_010444 [Sarracenia purpurea var. burkii]